MVDVNDYVDLNGDWMRAFAYLGAVLFISAAAYMRGHWDGSGLTAERWVSRVMESGPQWPLVVAGLGLILLFASVATRTEEMKLRSGRN